MAEILARELPARRAPADPASTDLPFLSIEGPHGRLCQRLERLKPSHHVGRIPVEAAREADAHLLSLLALDPSISGCDPRGALFLDVETTGLGGGAGTVAFLVGLAVFAEDGRLEVEQLFLRALGEERALLQRIAERIERSALMVTFNGKAFDLPLILGRFVMNRLAPPPARPHLDLLHVARRLHRARIGSCTLKSVEAAVLGFERDADIDGADVAPRYAHFLRTGDETRARRGRRAQPLGRRLDGRARRPLRRAARRAARARPPRRRAHVQARARPSRRARGRGKRRCRRGAGAEALRGSAEKSRRREGIGRARSRTSRRWPSEVDDPSLRLELAKLYEHHVKAPGRSAMVELGTGGGRKRAVACAPRAARRARAAKTT